MFASITTNPIVPHGKRVCGVPLPNQNVQYQMGLPEWQQKFETVHQYDYTKKDLHDNRVILDKPYLKANYSNFEYKHFPNKEPFLTSNKRDFIPIHMRTEDKAILSEDTRNFIKNSKIVFGTDPSTKHTVYQAIMKPPQEQIPKFNYDKIQFKYDPYNWHPITQQPIFKNPDNCWSFAYFNKDKDKHYVSNRNVSYINTDYRKVWDPITNRFFYGTSKNLNSENGGTIPKTQPQPKISN